MKHYERLSVRLGRILALLYERREVDIKEICAEFNVCEKTIYRDTKRLNMPEITRHNGKIILPYKPIRSDPEEQIALCVLQDIAKSLRGSIGIKALKLLNRLDSRNAISHSGAGENLANVFFTKTSIDNVELPLSSLALLQESAQGYVFVGFTYNGKARVVLPLKIVAFEGEWYLFGEECEDCENLEEDIARSSRVLKKYYLNDIKNVKLSTYTARKPSSLEHLDKAINAWYSPYREEIFISLWVDSRVAKYFKRKKLSSTQHIYPQSDGSLEITLFVTHFMEISGEILRWIPYIVVLEPKELKDFIADSVQKYVALLKREI